MRQHVNQVFKDGQVIIQSVVDWTMNDYNEAIKNAPTPDELFELLNEQAALLGIDAMTARIDQVADAKRLEILGDTTRAFEYQAAEQDAKAFAAASFEGEVPDNVMSWVIASGKSPQEAAENIMYEARLFSYARNVIRLFRLEGKQAVRSASTPEQAIDAYMTAIAKLSSISPV